MTVGELARKTEAINCEIIITHGLDGVGFEWRGLFIHDPFTDPLATALQMTESDDLLETLTDERVATLWSHVDGAATESGA